MCKVRATVNIFIITFNHCFDFNVTTGLIWLSYYYSDHLDSQPCLCKHGKFNNLTKVVDGHIIHDNMFLDKLPGETAEYTLSHSPWYLPVPRLASFS